MNHLKPEKYFFGLVALAIGIVGGVTTSALLLVANSGQDYSAQAYSSTITAPSFTLSCSGVPAVNQSTGETSVKWTAKISNLVYPTNSSYSTSYKWVGTDGLSTTVISPTKIYTTVGTKNATATVTFNSLKAGYSGATKSAGCSETVTPSLIITSPTSSSIWTAGTNQTVTWKTVNAPVGSTIEINLRNASGTLISRLATSTPNDGTQSVLVPNLSKELFHLELILRSTTGGIITFSNGQQNGQTFTIVGTTTPTITITYPNGGESWVEGKQYTVTWKSVGLDPNASVGIQLIEGSNGGASYGLVMNTDKPKVSDGSFTFTLSTKNSGPFPTSSKYKILLSANVGSNSPFDYSDNNFNVSTTTSTTTTSTVNNLSLSLENIVESGSYKINSLDSAGRNLGTMLTGSFLFRSENSTSTITRINAQVTSSMISPSVFYLYDGNDTLLDTRFFSGNASTTQISFSNLNIPVKSLKTLRIRVGMPTSTINGSSVKLNSIGVDYFRLNGTSGTVGLTGQGFYPQYFFTAIPNFVFVSGIASSTKPSTATNTAEITGRFTFKVKPEGASMLAFASNGSNFVIATSTNGAPITASKIVTVTPNQGVYNEGVEYTVTLDVVIPKSSFKASQNIALYIKSINWNMGTAVTQTWGLENFKTNTVTYLAQENSNNLIANVFYGMVDIINNVINKIGL